MLRLIKAEIYKLFKNTSFRVLCGVAVLLATINIVFSLVMTEDFLNKQLESVPEEQRQMLMEQLNAPVDEDKIVNLGQLGFNSYGWKDPYNGTGVEIFHTSFGSGVIEILIGVLIGAFMAKEYSEGTIKNTLAYGKKREHFYIAKFLATVVGIAVLQAIMTLFSTTVYTLIKGWGQPFEISQITGMATTFATALIASSAVAGILMVLATLIKNNGAIVGIAVGVFVILPSFVGFLYGNYDWFDTLFELSPFYNSAVAVSVLAKTSDLIRVMIIGATTTAISVGTGILVFKKQDIK